MADYYPLLARAVAALPNAGRDARLAIYERARKALLNQLRSLEPPVSEEHLEAESQALDAAVARLEAELEAEQPPAQAPAPIPQASAPIPLAVSPPAAPARPDTTAAPAATAPAPGGLRTADAAPAEATPSSRTPTSVRASLAARAGAASAVARPPGAAKPPLAPGRFGAPPPPKSAQASGAGGPELKAEGRSRLGALFSAKQHPPLPDEAAPKPPPPASSPDLPDGEEQAAVRSSAGRGDLPRPAAPIRPDISSRVPRQVLIWIPLIVLIGGGIGFAAWHLRVPQEEFARPRAGQEAREGSTKINERVGGGGEQAGTQAGAQQTPPATAQQPQPPAQTQPARPAQPQQQQVQQQQPQQQAAQPPGAIPAQRAAMLVQAAANDQQNVETHVGSTSWRIEESRRPGGAGLPALRADIDLPGVGLRLMFLIEKNNDTTLRASHMLTFRFLPQEGSRLPPVAEIGSPQMRNEAAPAVEPLAGASAKITDQIYIVALTADPNLTMRNLELIRSRGWFDLPLRLSDGRIAKITLEKGQLGERLLTQALDAWQR